MTLELGRIQIRHVRFGSRNQINDGILTVSGDTLQDQIMMA